MTTANDNSPQTATHRGPIEIIFGMPSRNCEKVGVCRIEFAGTSVACCDGCEQRTRVVLRYAPALRRLGLEIPLDDLTNLIWDRQFSRGYFEVMEPYELTEDICHYLEARCRLRLKPGRYAIAFNPVALCIHLEVEKIRLNKNTNNYAGHYFFPALLEMPKFKFG